MLRRSSRSLTSRLVAPSVAHGVAPRQIHRVFTPLRVNALSSPLHLRVVTMPLTSQVWIHHRHYSSNFDDWRRNTSLTDKIKTGAIVVAGVGVFALASSVALGFVVTGIVGLGAYGLYRTLRPSQNPFSAMQSSSFKPSRIRGGNPLVAGMPIMVQTILTGLFSLVGGALKQSWNRVTAVQEHVESKLQQHPSIRAQLGPNMRVGNPEQVAEQTVNGVGRIQALFPIVGGRHRAFVQVAASIDAENRLTYQKLQYTNQTTGETRDLLRDLKQSSVVLDAEYKEVP
ncbi:hypothetical protein AC1031_000212 [Aphanomyces cochlioides]|nr:hypothetical protein AC1031_000212 [Aphanomyces cochlioides]